MASTATARRVFDEQAALYERTILERWDQLEGWEKAQYAAFQELRKDRKAIRRLLATPEPSARRTGATLEESLAPGRALPRTVTLAYALAIFGLFFFPLVVQPLVIWLGLVNVVRRRFDHGLVQIALGAALLAVNLYAMDWLFANAPFVYNLMHRG